MQKKKKRKQVAHSQEKSPSSFPCVYLFAKQNELFARNIWHFPKNASHTKLSSVSVHHSFTHHRPALPPPPLTPPLRVVYFVGSTADATTIAVISRLLSLSNAFVTIESAIAHCPCVCVCRVFFFVVVGSLFAVVVSFRTRILWLRKSPYPSIGQQHADDGRGVCVCSFGGATRAQAPIFRWPRQCTRTASSVYTREIRICSASGRSPSSHLARDTL